MPPDQSQREDRKKTLSEVKNLRTFQDDVESLLKKENVTKSSIVIAEGERAVKEAAEIQSDPLPEVRPQNNKVLNISSAIPSDNSLNVRLIVIIAVSGVLLLSVAVGGLILWRNRGEPVATLPVSTVPKTNTISLQGAEKRAGVLAALQKGIDASTPAINEMVTIPVMRNGSVLTTEELFSLLETSAPDSLPRALGKAPTLGVHNLREKQTFLLFPVSSYDYAFAGMLGWEPTFFDDVGPIFGLSSRNVTGDGATTTENVASNPLPVKDTIVRNKDVRAVFSPKGDIVLLYSFVDKQTLVITTNEATLQFLQNKTGGGRIK